MVAAGLIRRIPCLWGQDPEGFAHLVIAKRPDVTDPKFLYVMTKRDVIDASIFYARRRGVESVYMSESDFVDKTPDLRRDGFEGADARLDFEAITAALGEPLGTTLRLYFGESLNLEQVGERTGVTKSAVSLRIQHGVKQARAMLRTGTLRTGPARAVNLETITRANLWNSSCPTVTSRSEI